MTTSVEETLGITHRSAGRGVRPADPRHRRAAERGEPRRRSRPRACCSDWRPDHDQGPHRRRHPRDPRPPVAAPRDGARNRRGRHGQQRRGSDPDGDGHASGRHRHGHQHAGHGRHRHCRDHLAAAAEQPRDHDERPRRGRASEAIDARGRTRVPRQAVQCRRVLDLDQARPRARARAPRADPGDARRVGRRPIGGELAAVARTTRSSPSSPRRVESGGRRWRRTWRWRSASRPTSGWPSSTPTSSSATSGSC